MIWLVWNNDGETEADSRRIDASNYFDAAEEWARCAGRADPTVCNQHIRDGLVLLARTRDEDARIYKLKVSATSIVYYCADRIE